jgi:hypothetical protein
LGFQVNGNQVKEVVGKFFFQAKVILEIQPKRNEESRQSKTAL